MGYWPPKEIENIWFTSIIVTTHANKTASSEISKKKKKKPITMQTTTNGAYRYRILSVPNLHARPQKFQKY